MIAAVSGGFDPITPGHLDLLESASDLGDVKVILNSDEWLIRKKGYYLFNWAERARLLYAIRGVDEIIRVDDSDGTVCEALSRTRPDFFVNGGDRTDKNTPELALCKELGIKPVFTGDPKISSSSVVMRRGVSERKWGRYELIYQGPTDQGYIKIKRLILNPLSETSRQRHKFREEHFFPLSGSPWPVIQLQDRRLAISDGTRVDSGVWHSIVNESEKEASVIEVQVGSVADEDDIERAD